MPTSPLNLLDRVIHGRATPTPTTQSLLPLQGLTILAVEDSRFASDALRLLCQRSGARLRRVDTLHAAYSHLRVYRPDVMLVDMGLPDGRGDALIADLAQHRPQGPVIIAISGDPDAKAEAMAAGADGFIEKPFPTLAAFQSEILRHLPDRADRNTIASKDSMLSPDPLALHDDLQHAADLVHANPTPQQRRYLAGFVTGIARSANDPALVAAAQALTNANGLDGLSYLLTARINGSKGAFSSGAP
jgi:CheY-like chemotaxis protein